MARVSAWGGAPGPRNWAGAGRGVVARVADKGHWVQTELGLGSVGLGGGGVVQDLGLG